MKIWALEINELKSFHESIEGQFPAIDKELKHLFKTKDANVVLLYSRRCLEVIVSEVCERELRRPRKTEPLQGIIDKLNKEGKVPPHIITSMLSLNSFSTYGAHPMDFDPEQVRPVVNNLTVIIRWYKKYKDSSSGSQVIPEKGKTPYPEPVLDFRDENKRKQIAFSLFGQQSGRILSLLILLGIVLLGGYGLIRIISGGKQSFFRANQTKTIAVLQFKYESKDSARFSFCDGFVEDLRYNLRKIKNFTVRFNPLFDQYRELAISVPLIKRELNADYLVDGSVEHSGDSLYIRISLTDSKAKKLLWGDKYTRYQGQLSSLPKEIVKKIAAELNITLTTEEVNRIDKNQTSSYNAYSRFLTANSMNNDAEHFVWMGSKYNDSSSFENAINAYTQAISYDPLYAPAYAKRAISRSWGFYTRKLKDKSNIQKCFEDIEKAREIDPDLIDIQIASGFYYYYCVKDYTKAIEFFRKASEEEPGNSEPVFYQAMVYRRLGNWEKSQHILAGILNNNLNNSLILTNIGLSYVYLRNYDSAVIYHEKAMEVTPGWPAPYNNEIEALLLKNGTTKEAGIILEKAEQKTGRSFVHWKIDLDIYDGNLQEALSHLKKSNPSDYEDKGRMYLHFAQLYNYLKDLNLARIYYDSARTCFVNRQQQDPDNTTFISLAGIANAGLNNRNEAVDLGKKALKLAGNDMIVIPERKRELAQIYVMLKDYDNALKEIEYLLKNNTCFSVKFMKLDPLWRPLTERPEFRKFITGSQIN
jgi:tetratricopeptide (TPR) repeat protein